MANRGLPSLAALLGLVAIAGYQNRDKIGEFIKGLQGSSSGGSSSGASTGGLGELVDRFKKAGQGETAESWVGKGENKPVTTDELEKGLGPDLIDGLVKQTGLTRDELLSRLSKVLPEAVDRLTPEGRIPA